MSDLTPEGLLTKLLDLHAPIRVPTISEYQYACGEAALEIDRLRSEVHRLNRKLDRIDADIDRWQLRAYNEGAVDGYRERREQEKERG